MAIKVMIKKVSNLTAYVIGFWCEDRGLMSSFRASSWSLTFIYGLWA